MGEVNYKSKDSLADEMGLERWDDNEDAGIGWYGVYRWENGRWELEQGVFLKDGCRQIVSNAKSFTEAVRLLEVEIR